MTKKTENTNVKTINKKAIEELRKTIRSSWITSVKAIYAFGKEHSKASIEVSLTEIGLGLTKKANAFTGAAKLGLSEFYEGRWTVCDGQVSRYARVCNYLNSLKIRAALSGHLRQPYKQTNLAECHPSCRTARRCSTDMNGKKQS